MGSQKLPWMRLKCHCYRRSPQQSCAINRGTDHRAMAAVHAIEIADSNYAAA
jgi:hypothetical protein